MDRMHHCTNMQDDGSPRVTRAECHGNDDAHVRQRGKRTRTARHVMMICTIALLDWACPAHGAIEAKISLESAPSVLLSGIPTKLSFRLMVSSPPAVLGAEPSDGMDQGTTLHVEAADINGGQVLATENVFVKPGLAEHFFGLSVVLAAAEDTTLVVRVHNTATGTVLASEQLREIRTIPAFTCLLPIFSIIVVVVGTANVFSGLLVGLFVAGTLISPSFNPFAGLMRVGDTLLYNGISQSSTAIILFIFFSSGLTAVITKNGGCHGLCKALSPLATSRERAQAISIFAAILTLMGGFFSVMLVGSIMGPMSRMRGVSRAKLAFILDSTSAPISALSFCSPWTGFKIGVVQQQLSALGISDTSLSVIARAVPYSFFPMLSIAFALLVALSGRDFGPMLAAEQEQQKKARDAGGDSSDEEEAADSGAGAAAEGAEPAAAEQEKLDALRPHPGTPLRSRNAVMPMLLLIGSLAYGVWDSGSTRWREQHGEGDVPSWIDVVAGANVIKVLLWASVASNVAAVLLSTAQGLLSLEQSVEAFLQGCSSVVPGAMMLVLTFTVGYSAQLLHVGGYVVSLVGEGVSLSLVPPVGFLLAAFISATSGSSWGSMSILYPILMPLAARDSSGSGDGEAGELLVQTVAAALSGAVLGDQISPVSDTSVLSAIFAHCPLMHHVWTQLPYVSAVAAVSVAAFWLSAAWRVPSLVCSLLGFASLWALLASVGRGPEQAGRSVGRGGFRLGPWKRGGDGEDRARMVDAEGGLPPSDATPRAWG